MTSDIPMFYQEDGVDLLDLRDYDVMVWPSYPIGVSFGGEKSVTFGRVEGNPCVYVLRPEQDFLPGFGPPKTKTLESYRREIAPFVPA